MLMLVLNKFQFVQFKLHTLMSQTEILLPGIFARNITARKSCCQEKLLAIAIFLASSSKFNLGIEI